jgi:hypothetical protein
VVEVNFWTDDCRGNIGCPPIGDGDARPMLACHDLLKHRSRGSDLDRAIAAWREIFARPAIAVRSASPSSVKTRT